MKSYLLLIALFLLAGFVRGEELVSPNGMQKLQFEVIDGTPVYQLFFKEQPIIAQSKLGLELKNEENLLDGFELGQVEKSTFDETWNPVWGEAREIRNHYNEMAVTLNQAKTNRKIIIVITSYSIHYTKLYEIRKFREVSTTIFILAHELLRLESVLIFNLKPD